MYIFVTKLFSSSFFCSQQGTAVQLLPYMRFKFSYLLICRSSSYWVRDLPFYRQLQFKCPLHLGQACVELVAFGLIFLLPHFRTSVGTLNQINQMFSLKWVDTVTFCFSAHKLYYLTLLCPIRYKIFSKYFSISINLIILLVSFVIF